MRIVSWNMNQQGRDAWEFLEGTLDPDVALLQETIVPEEVHDRYEVKWTEAWAGKRWGSAVLSRVGKLKPVWDDSSRGAAVLVHSLVPGVGAVSIASLHARIVDGRVIPALRETFDELRPRLGDRFIVGGDLNTARSAALAWPRNGHGEFWDDIEAWGLKEPMPFNGGERQSYWREWRQNKPPTIGNSLQDDHVLLDAETTEYVTHCLVWDTLKVRGLSDHGPVVVDFDFSGDAR